MLSRILKEFRVREESLCAEEVARAVHEDPSTVETKLEELTRMGYLMQTAGEEACEACRARTTCALIPLQRRTYQLRPGGPRGKNNAAKRTYG